MTDTNRAMRIAFANADTMTVEAHEQRAKELYREAWDLAYGISLLENAGDKGFDVEEWEVYNTETGESLTLGHDSGFSSYDEAEGALYVAMMVTMYTGDDERYGVRKLNHIQRSQWVRVNHKKFEAKMKLIRNNRNRLAHARNMAHVS